MLRIFNSNSYQSRLLNYSYYTLPHHMYMYFQELFLSISPVSLLPFLSLYLTFPLSFCSSFTHSYTPLYLSTPFPLFLLHSFSSPLFLSSFPPPSLALTFFLSLPHSFSLSSLPHAHNHLLTPLSSLIPLSISFLLHSLPSSHSFSLFPPFLPHSLSSSVPTSTCPPLSSLSSPFPSHPLPRLSFAPSLFEFIRRGDRTHFRPSCASANSPTSHGISWSHSVRMKPITPGQRGQPEASWCVLVQPARTLIPGERGSSTRVSSSHPGSGPGRQ